MKKTILLFTLILLANTLNAQELTLAHFENFFLDQEGHLNGIDGSGGFESGNIFLPNNYNFQFDAWSGWSITNVTDNTTPSYLNQYSAITGIGELNSNNYATAYAYDPVHINLINEAKGKALEGMYLTNSTYAYWSMKDGDSFTKKFGGVTGNDPDYFLLTIRAYLNGQLSSESIEFYLADYRFEDNSQDYIIDEWTHIDLSSLGNVDSLQCTLSSSDVGDFGMNNPAYFCVDNITTTDAPIGINTPTPTFDLAIYPNPSTNFCSFNWTQGTGIVRILDIQGRVGLTQNLKNGLNQVSLATLPSGTYVLQLQTENGMASKKVVKQ